MIKTKKIQRGYALVASLIISSLVLTTLGVVMYKINSNTKDIIRVQHREQALHFAEEGVEHALHYINWKNGKEFPNDPTPAITAFGFPIKNHDGTFTSGNGNIPLKGVTAPSYD